MNQFQPSQIIPLLITEYNYQEGYFFGSYRATLSENPYIELTRFPPSTVFRGVALGERQDDSWFGIRPAVKLSNGAIGYLDGQSSFTKTNSHVSVGLELDIAIYYLSISPIIARLALIGTWTNSYKEQNRSDTKEILDIGKNVFALLVQKEEYGLFFEYQSCKIFVTIPLVTWDCRHTYDVLEQFKIGVEYPVKIICYEYRRDQYDGSLLHANKYNPYWELTNDKPGTVYQGTVYMAHRYDDCNSYIIQLPNGAYGDLDSKDTSGSLSKGDKIDVIIKSLQPLTYKSIPLTLETPNTRKIL